MLLLLGLRGHLLMQTIDNATYAFKLFNEIEGYISKVFFAQPSGWASLYPFLPLQYSIPIGTPIIAVESGYVEALGWNQYGGWRIGIRSFDGMRYYYYAHLRQNYPYQEKLKEGDVVTTGDVIGYMGHTGYSTTENVNNIDEVHLHFGLQLIFDESQKEGNNEIWIDCYDLTRFLSRNRSEVYKVEGTKEWKRVLDMKDENTKDAEKTVEKNE